MGLYEDLIQLRDTARYTAREGANKALGSLVPVLKYTAANPLESARSLVQAVKGAPQNLRALPDLIDATARSPEGTTVLPGNVGPIEFLSKYTNPYHKISYGDQKILSPETLMNSLEMALMLGTGGTSRFAKPAASTLKRLAVKVPPAEGGLISKLYHAVGDSPSAWKNVLGRHLEDFPAFEYAVGNLAKKPVTVARKALELSPRAGGTGSEGLIEVFRKSILGGHEPAHVLRDTLRGEPARAFDYLSSEIYNTMGPKGAAAIDRMTSLYPGSSRKVAEMLSGLEEIMQGKVGQIGGVLKSSIPKEVLTQYIQMYQKLLKNPEITAKGVESLSKLVRTGKVTLPKPIMYGHNKWRGAAGVGIPASLEAGVDAMVTKPEKAPERAPLDQAELDKELYSIGQILHIDPVMRKELGDNDYE
jgi:hypothetical protein